MDEQQLSSILNDPEKMQKIMALAQSFQAQEAPPESKPPAPPPQPAFPDIDPNLLRKLSGLATQGGIDKNQKNLLNALSPYLSRQRLQRLERAMQAAHLAGVATTFLENR